MKNSTRHGAEVSIDIINRIKKLQVTDFAAVKNVKQVHSTIYPIISNAMYHRDKEILMNERMRVIRDLARALDDTNFEKAINELGFTIIDSQGKMSC